MSSSVGLMPTNSELLQFEKAQVHCLLSLLTLFGILSEVMSHSFGFIIIIVIFSLFLFLLYISSFFHSLPVCLCFAFRNLLLCFGALLCLPSQFDFRSEIIGIEIGFVWAAAAAAAYFALCTLFLLPFTE